MGYGTNLANGNTLASFTPTIGTLIDTATNDRLYLFGVSKQTLLANAAPYVHIV